MAQATHDPFRVIETVKPAFEPAEACELARARYGLEVEASELVSERDQNFRLRSADGDEYVLKFANPAENPMVAAMQIRALLHLEAYQRVHESALRVPRVRRTLEGEPSFVHAWHGQPVTVRLVTFVPGKPLGTPSMSPALCRNLGAGLAELDLGLAGFDHEGADQSLLWDMKQALELRRLLPHVPDEPNRDRLRRALDDFEHDALPAFSGLRWQVIHNDLNPDNVLVDAQDPERVAGVIDFGDMCRSPLVVDVAVAASYLRAVDGNPLAAIGEFVAGYTANNPLRREEADLLFDLVRARLAATICILHWRRTLRPADDAYLRDAAMSGPVAETFLARLSEIPRAHARQVFRQICAGSRL